MREDIPHPDKRKSLRVVLYIPEDSPETWKGIRFALPLHSQALRGMVWDWRSFHSLVPKVASFGVSHEEEREHKPLTRRRELTTDYVVFEGGASPPSTPFLMPTHQGGDEQKKIRRQRHKRLTYLSPRDILYMLKGDKVFSIDLRGLLTTFRASEVYGSCISRICGFCEFPR